MTEAVQAVEGTSCGWWYCGSWCADTSCTASFYVWFKSHIDECEISSNSELMLYEFEPDYKAVEAIKNIYCPKREDAVDHSRVTRWFKKFHSGYKNINDQTRTDKSKTVNAN